MGLNEKRKMKELQEVTFPERTKELAEIVGATIPYEVDWDSLADSMEALNFIDNLSCHRTNMAFRGICIDPLGKEAVQEGLKRIKLKNVKTPEEIFISFKDGVLEMHCAYALGASGMISDNIIQRTVEDGL